MRKCYFLLLGLLSFIGVNTVSADTYNFPYDLSYYSDANLTEEQLISYLDAKIDTVLNYWEENLKKDYPYYYIGINSVVIGSRVDLNFHYLSAIPFNGYYGGLLSSVNESQGILNISIYCTGDNICYDEIVNRPSDYKGYFYPLFHYEMPGSEIISRHYLPFSYYTSNFDYIFNESDTFNIVKDNEIIYSLNNGDIIPTYKDLFINKIKDNYIQIDLNNYSYVALSLKDYNDIPKNNSSRYTNFYVKGQLCVTPVYNYGLTERKDVLTNSKMQGCSQYYDDFTLTRMYILKTDVENHAIYYFKAYDTSKDNILKVDTSIFNITYISEENKDNPEVLINNKYYPTLPYDSLTDTAIKSESEGYVSGTTCAVGDFNCYSENNSENLFDEIFSSPLNFLKSIWDSVTSIFSLIAEFISLLPIPMQSFLYLSFMIAIILGLLKILL